MSASETAKSSKITSHSYSHLRKYPLVADTSAFVERFSTVKVIESYTNTLVTRLVGLLSNVSIAVSILNYLDQTTDAALSYVDKTFPSITSVSYESISKTLESYYNGWASQSVKRVRTTFSNATAVVRSRVSSVVKILNDYYEAVIDRLLPLEKQAEAKAQEVSDAAQSELARSRKLLSSTYERAQPYVSQVSSLPTYVTEVYSDEKASASTPVALAKTSRRLSNEAYTSAIKPTYDARIKPTVDRLIGSRTESPVDKVVEAVNGSL
ncbi:hypothetical protein OGAPHI_001272 [Ogataea philodendri]|uniref:Uncharacterized protein n=1 Tax=Ogataea philodendri TaxID=1378263 RepID=A0A9P8T9D4_9ASCO|nr:uncharacterized protein OGAPHI_001272 [Ogataea philodendri]KAH3670756.1 hypothetical protein OGAPHI_001272 [Ogataea philodendri]